MSRFMDNLELIIASRGEEGVEDLGIDYDSIERWQMEGPKRQDIDDWGDELQEAANEIRNDPELFADALREGNLQRKESHQERVSDAHDQGIISSSRYEAEMDYIEDEYDEEEFDEVVHLFQIARETGAGDDWQAYRDAGGDRDTP